MLEANQDFSDTADINTSSDDYAKRFSGKTGEWFLTVQSDIVISMLRNLGCRSILEVGGGHGQLIGPLCRSGFDVTVLGYTVVDSLAAPRIQALGTLPYNQETKPFKEHDVQILNFRPCRHRTI